MIPVYRKIRKKMADDNRPLKYARYAIGEIVLVVIGILIALQINTWNEGRKEKNKAKAYADKLINDIVQDTLNINELINTGHEKTANINAYFISRVVTFGAKKNCPPTIPIRHTV